MYLYSAIAVTLRRRNVTLSCSSTKDNDQGKREAVKMNWNCEVDFNLCAVLYFIMAVTGLQDEVPMTCLGKGVICFLVFVVLNLLHSWIHPCASHLLKVVDVILPEQLFNAAFKGAYAEKLCHRQDSWAARLKLHQEILEFEQWSSVPFWG